MINRCHRCGGPDLRPGVPGKPGDSNISGDKAGSAGAAATAAAVTENPLTIFIAGYAGGQVGEAAGKQVEARRATSCAEYSARRIPLRRRGRSSKVLPWEGLPAAALSCTMLSRKFSRRSEHVIDMAYSPKTTFVLSFVCLAVAGVFWFLRLPTDWLAQSRDSFVPETAAIGVILLAVALYQYWQEGKGKT